MKAFDPLQHEGSVFSILENVPFLGGITETQRRLIFNFLERASYEAGELIARKGETPTHIYIIKSGRVGLVLEHEGNLVSKRQFGAGASFGEAALLSLINNTASFRADEASELIVLSRKSLNALRKKDPEIFTHLMVNMARELARKLQYTDEMLLRKDLG